MANEDLRPQARLKPPRRPARGLRGRGLIALGVAVVAFTGLALVRTPLALADPTNVVTAVGTGTTEDVYNQFATDAGGNLLGSWNATDPVTQVAHETITPVTNGVPCSFTRPDGSDEGQVALRWSLGLVGVGPISGTPPGPGCVTIARSTTGPEAAADPSGPLVFIPFALDGIAGSTGPSTCTPGGVITCGSYTYGYPPYPPPPANVVTATPVPTDITAADLFTVSDLETLYDNCQPVTEGGVTYDPTGTIGTKIDLYVPQLGSETRTEWARLLGFNPVTLPACVHDTIVGGALASAAVPVPVWENDGTAVATDPNGFAPFSISAWMAQRNLAVPDTRHMASLHNLTPATGGTAVSPFSNGNSANGTLNPNFPLTNVVYSVVSYTAVTDATNPLYSLLNSANPPGAFLCTEQSGIITYGFALVSDCGAVLNSLRSD